MVFWRRNRAMEWNITCVTRKARSQWLVLDHHHEIELHKILNEPSGPVECEIFVLIVR